MPAKPSHLIEHIAAAMVVEQDRRLWIACKKLLLNILSEKFRIFNNYGLVFLAGPDIDQTECSEGLSNCGGFQQHGGIVDVTRTEVGQHLGHREP